MPEPARPGTTPETAIFVDNETYDTTFLGEPTFDEMKPFIATAGGEAPVAYVRTEEPRTAFYRDNNGNYIRVERNIFGVNLMPHDFGTYVRSMGAYMIDADGEITMVADPANNQFQSVETN